MTVKTSKGKTYKNIRMWGPVSDTKELYIRLTDPEESLDQLFEDFSGCERFERFSETEGDMVFEGYTKISSINKKFTPEETTVTIWLTTEGD